MMLSPSNFGMKRMANYISGKKNSISIIALNLFFKNKPIFQITRSAVTPSASTTIDDNHGLLFQFGQRIFFFAHTNTCSLTMRQTAHA